MDYNILFGFMTAVAALAISPGPDNMYVLMQSITNGRAFGLATVAGLISGCLVHTTLVAFGVSAIIKAYDSMFFTIKLLGAFYLFYLAYQVFRSDSRVALFNKNAPKNTLWRLFKQGFIMNVLNPKVSIFFLAFFPSFLFSNSLSHVSQFYVLGLLFMLVSFIIFSLTTGPYKWIRNPMYVAVILFYLPIVIKHFKWINSLVFMALLITLLLKIKSEEEFLLERFGKDYFEYKKKTKRFIPFIF